MARGEATRGDIFKELTDCGDIDHIDSSRHSTESKHMSFSFFNPRLPIM
jgi:hypothetical protein